MVLLATFDVWWENVDEALLLLRLSFLQKEISLIQDEPELFPESFARFL